MYKIVYDTITEEVLGFASGNSGIEHMLVDQPTRAIAVIGGDMLPDRMEACRYDGFVITVDQAAKTAAEDNDQVEELIRDKAEVQRREAAIAELKTDGALNEDGTLKKN